MLGSINYGCLTSSDNCSTSTAGSNYKCNWGPKHCLGRVSLSGKVVFAGLICHAWTKQRSHHCQLGILSYLQKEKNGRLTWNSGLKNNHLLVGNLWNWQTYSKRWSHRPWQEGLWTLHLEQALLPECEEVLVEADCNRAATLKAHRPFSTFHFDVSSNARLSSTPF